MHNIVCCCEFSGEFNGGRIFVAEGELLVGWYNIGGVDSNNWLLVSAEAYGDVVGDIEAECPLEATTSRR